MMRPARSESLNGSGSDPNGDAEAAEWPLDLPLGQEGVIVQGMLNVDPCCLTITGEDVRLIWEAATLAPTHVWVDGGERWDVFLRPALPHESDPCSTLAP
jgi:hypothetical protein